MTTLENRIAAASFYKDHFDSEVARLAKKDSNYNDYLDLVEEIYDMPGFLDLKPLSIANMGGLQDDPETEKEWLRIRKHGPNGDIPHIVGGSSVAAILGVSPWSSPLMAKAKLQEIELKKPEVTSGEQFVRGHDAEPYIADKINRFDGFKDVEVFDDPTFYQHPVFGFMAGNIDRFLRFEDGRVGIAEVKSTSAEYGNRPVVEKWQAGIIPDYYRTQTLWYMAIMNMDTADFFCGWGLSQATEMAHAHMKRDIQAEKEMIAYILFFLEVVVKKDGEPDLTNAKGELILKDFYQIKGDNFHKDVRSTSSDPELILLIKELELAKQEESALKAAQKAELAPVSEKASKLEAEVAIRIQEILEDEVGDGKDVQSGGIVVESDGKQSTIYYKSKETARFALKKLEQHFKDNEDEETFKKLKEIGQNITISKSVAIGKWKAI